MKKDYLVKKRFQPILFDKKKVICKLIVISWRWLSSLRFLTIFFEAEGAKGITIPHIHEVIESVTVISKNAKNYTELRNFDNVKLEMFFPDIR